MQQAAQGRGRFVLIAGEAGIGKTRFLDQVARETREAGGVAGSGRCLELHGAGIPFAPIKAALGELASAHSETGPTPPDLEPTGATQEPVGISTDTRQARLFEACLRYLSAVGQTQPALLIVEDIHWADPSTLELLSYLAQAQDDAPFAVAASFRSDELHRKHPLQAFLGQIQRRQVTDRLDLARFSQDDVADQLSAILGEEASPELISRVYERSDGNAFYVEEVVAAELGGQPLPPQMRDVLLARASWISDSARELLGVISAAGGDVSTSVISRVTGSKQAELEHNIREAVEAHLIVPSTSAGEEHLAFRHSLVREAVYAELLPGQRSRLHARYARALEDASAAADDNARLAYHWDAAHDQQRAVGALIKAGIAADRNNARADASRHYERALALWDQVEDAPQNTGIDRIDLLVNAARAASAADPARAAGLMREAIRDSAGTDDMTRLGLLKERYGRYAYLAGDGFAALDACREATALVPEEPPTIARARVLASLGQIMMITLHTHEAKLICEQAVKAARAVDAADVECHGLNSLGTTHVYLGDLDTGLMQLNESLELARRIGSVDDVGRALVNLADALSHSGRLREAGEMAITAFEYAREHGLGRGIGVVALAEGALAYYRLGQWGDAADMLRRARRQGLSGVGQIMVEQRQALLEVGEGNFEAADARIATARSLIGRAVEPQLIAPLAEAAAELALWQQRPIEARTELAAALDRLKPQPAEISRLGPLLALAVRAEADISELARVRHDDAGLSASAHIAQVADATMERLDAAAAAGFPNFVSQSAAWLSACRAELTRMNGATEAGSWALASDAFDSMPMEYPRAYALWRRAEALLSRSRGRSSATPVLREAFALASRLGAQPLLEAINSLGLRAGIDPSVEASSDVPEPSKAEDGLGLTRREREILKLIATGRTNRQIAEELFITEGTAATHVSNILGKLGVRARTEAASVAYRMRLVD